MTQQANQVFLDLLEALRMQGQVFMVRLEMLLENLEVKKVKEAKLLLT